MSKLFKQPRLLLIAALIVGVLVGFFGHDLAIAASSIGTSPRTVSKTVTVMQFTCTSINYDFEEGNFCVVDKIPLARQPTSMNCMATATFATSGFTLAERCDPNGTLIGNPFFVAWKSGSLELLVEDGTYNFMPPRVVTYSAVV